MKFSRIFSVVLVVLFTGCASLIRSDTQIEQFKKDLIGHTMGGREKSWKFQSVDQFKRFTVLAQLGNRVFVRMILKGEGTYLADAVLTYSDGKLKTVGLLYIEKID